MAESSAMAAGQHIGLLQGMPVAIKDLIDYAGIPTTHRDHCSSLTVLTGHEKPGKPETAINWQHVADEPGTRLILMGMERLREITGKLLTGVIADWLGGRRGFLVALVVSALLTFAFGWGSSETIFAGLNFVMLFAKALWATSGNAILMAHAFSLIRKL